MSTQSVLYSDMLQILNSYGGYRDLPEPSNRHWGANITKWLKRRLNVEFIEHTAKIYEGQKWSWSRRKTARVLQWELTMETLWRLRMENLFQEMLHGIVFGISGIDEWEATVIQCDELGFNVGFVEDIERRQNSQPWDRTLRDRAKSLEWEFYRTLIISKYSEGARKATKTVVREMLEEKGIKLS